MHSHPAQMRLQEWTLLIALASTQESIAATPVTRKTRMQSTKCSSCFLTFRSLTAIGTETVKYSIETDHTWRCAKHLLRSRVHAVYSPCIAIERYCAQRAHSVHNKNLRHKDIISSLCPQCAGSVR